MNAFQILIFDHSSSHVRDHRDQQAQSLQDFDYLVVYAQAQLPVNEEIFEGRLGITRRFWSR